MARYAGNMDMSPHHSVYNYFLYKRNLRKDENNQPFYKGTTLRGWFSMFQKLFRLSRNVELKVLIPQLLDRLNEWEHMDEAPLQAATMSVEEVRQVLELPKTAEFLPAVVHMILGINGAQRGCENGPYRIKSEVSF